MKRRAEGFRVCRVRDGVLVRASLKHLGSQRRCMLDRRDLRLDHRVWIHARSKSCGQCNWKRLVCVPSGSLGARKKLQNNRKAAAQECPLTLHSLTSLTLPCLQDFVDTFNIFLNHHHNLFSLHRPCLCQPTHTTCPLRLPTPFRLVTWPVKSSSATRASWDTPHG
jgi:hypothetical protein